VAQIPPLVREAIKKAGVVWIAATGSAHAQACWQHWNGEASYLVTGPGEQPLRIAAGGTCTVTARSASTGGRIVTWVATVDAVEPGSAEWDGVLPALLAARLNAPESATLGQRWAQHNTILRLVPTGELLP
jgi:hypothetical protein